VSGRTGNDRVVALFREVQGVPVTRETVEGVARQKDFMRRIRADNGRGTRDLLAAEGILLLSGKYDGPLNCKLSLPMGDFVAYTPANDQERQPWPSCGGLRCGDPVLPDDQGPVQAAARADDGNGGRSARDGWPGSDRAGLYDLVPSAETAGRPDRLSAR